MKWSLPYILSIALSMLLGGLSAVILLRSVEVAFAGSSEIQQKVEAKRALIESWGKDPQLVNAVEEATMHPFRLSQSLTQLEWESLSSVDEKVRFFQSTRAAEFLRFNRKDWVSEAFVSKADGTKVGFLEKPSNWSHEGKPKHEQPMDGKVWEGELEVDRSAGREQIQIAVPILSGRTPIGSLVVGIDPNKL